MHQTASESTIRTGMLVVNLDTCIVLVNDQPVHLTGKEYGILELLSLRKGTILTKEMILNHLYAGMNEPEIKIIDVFVCKLRKKLAQATGGNHYIETVWGRGYVLRDPATIAGIQVAQENPDRSPVIRDSSHLTNLIESLPPIQMVELSAKQPSGGQAMNKEQRATGEHCREIADKVRQLARKSDITQIREELFDLADRLDQMAENVENDRFGPAGQYLS